MAAAFTGGKVGGRGWHHVDVPQSQNDFELLAAPGAGKRIRVLWMAVSCGAAPSTVAPASATVALGATINNSIVLTGIPDGKGGLAALFECGVNASLTVDTGAGSTTGIFIVYEIVG